MSDLLRLARELDKEADSWLETAENARSSGVKDHARECKARSVGLRQAAEMARHMHNQGSMRRNPVTAACDDCHDTGWYGDNGPGVIGNEEFHRCECGASEKCSIGAHRYVMVDTVPWCETCNREADLSVCRLSHPLTRQTPDVCAGDASEG